MGVEKKIDRMEALIQGLPLGSEAGRGGFDPCYLGYFECFNAGRYYEAHDVLEHLWLRQGRLHADHAFHKGLIQFSGAFVHLKLQHAHPDHPKHGRRLDPARRLFLLAAANLTPYQTRHHGIDPREPVELCSHFASLLGDAKHRRTVPVNPWNPHDPPRLSPPENER